ncbi:MAG: hypothetical protein A3F17_08810 [Gammaproteobacteria bacterium RIFCSPHIGHO2_12_FULL_41_15]|nr:MAG: hypothetical protein A3F17_08810 [Gammaproteobacteria bacterium RIFCSPHIGHO2_12_FULL_41_15]
MNNRIARLDIRTSHAAKATIEHAAEELGVTISAFILESAMEKAKKVLEQAQIIKLTAKESKRFIEILESPPKPNKNLKKLFKQDKKITKKEG